MYFFSLFGLLVLLSRHASSLTGYRGEPRSYSLVMTSTQKGATIDVSKGFKYKTEVPDEIEADLSVSGLNRVRLFLNRKRLMAVPARTEMSQEGKAGKFKKYENEDVYFYTNKDGSGSFACELTQKKSGKYICKMSGLISVGNYSCYIGMNSENADCAARESGERRVYKNRADFRKSVSKLGNVPTSGDTVLSSNKSTNYDLPRPGYRVVEITMVVDGEFMRLFYDRNPGNTNAAQQEVTIYMTLLASEMNVFYDSVRVATNGDLVLFVYPIYVLFHATPGNNFDWSRLSVVGGNRLEVTQRMDERLYAFVRAVQREYRPADHVMVFTGLGSDHDEQIGCPGSTYVMASSAFAISPRTQDTHYRFSPCSINAMRNHLNTRTDCTRSNGFTDEQFQRLFCGGFLGSQSDSLDQQCQIQTGNDASRACGTVTNEDSGCYATNQVSCRIQSGACTTNLRHIWNGTPCGTAGNKRCFKGRCVENLIICDTTVDPVDPIDPVDPVDPVDPIGPVDPLEPLSDSPCSCCGFKRDKRRRRCCRKGRLSEGGEDCYCCGELLNTQPPDDFNGNTY